MSIHNLEMKLIDADLKLKRKTNVTYEKLIQEVNAESEKKEYIYGENMCDENLSLIHISEPTRPY